MSEFPVNVDLWITIQGNEDHADSWIANNEEELSEIQMEIKDIFDDHIREINSFGNWGFRVEKRKWNDD